MCVAFCWWQRSDYVNMHMVESSIRWGEGAHGSDSVPVHFRQRPGGTYGLGRPVETSHSRVTDEAGIGTSSSWREVEKASSHVSSSFWALANTCLRCGHWSSATTTDARPMVSHCLLCKEANSRRGHSNVDQAVSLTLTVGKLYGLEFVTSKLHMQNWRIYAVTAPYLQTGPCLHVAAVT